MSEPSPFNRNTITESAAVPEAGLLDQLGLPPDLVKFLRKHQRTIWIVSGCIAFILVVVSAYGSYTAYRDEKAASALTEALKAEDDQRKAELAQVVADYGSTSAGIWARIETAHLLAEEGETDQAIQDLLAVQKEVSGKNPVMPLLMFNLAGLYENRNELDKALASLNELAVYKGFDAVAYKAMGRIYEQQGNTGEAVAMYQKYITATEKEDVSQGADPDRQMIEARINSLRE